MPYNLVARIADMLKMQFVVRPVFDVALRSLTYAPSDRPQPLQQLAEGHLLRLHPHDHPPQGQRESSRPAHGHFGGEKRQLACWLLDGSAEADC